MMRRVLPRSLSLSVACAALAVGCAHAARPTVEPPARGVVVVFAVGAPPARCRVEVERLPAAASALGVATIARKEGRAGEIRAIAVELEGDRPVLAVALAPAASGGDASTPEGFCAWAREATARLERDALGRSGEAGAPEVWPTDLDAGRVHFRSVQRLSRGGETTGFAEYAIGARADGTRVLVSRGAVLTRPRGGWQATDLVHLEDADARGTLERGRYARIGGGRVQYRVEVRRTGERGYACSGEANGQPVDGGFDTASGLATMFLRIDLFRERDGSGPPAPVRTETYDPLSRPVGPTPFVLRRDPSRPRGIVIQIGSRTATGVVERDGILEWTETPDDPPARTETIWRGGAP